MAYSAVKRFAITTGILSTVLLFLSGITSVLAITMPSLIFGFLLVPTFISFMVSIHYYADKKMRLFGMLGIVFAVMYGILIGFNYYLQLTLVQPGILSSDLLSMTNPNSIMWVIEVLGYFFMGLSTLSVVPVFKSGLLEKSIKLLFAVNGLMGIGGLIGYALRLDLMIMYGGLVLWNILMPIATALTVIYFKNNNPADV